MKKIFVFLCLASVLSLFGGCVSPDNFTIKGVEKVDFVSTSKMSLGLNIENRSGRNVTIESFKAKIFRGDKEFATIVLLGKVKIQRRSDATVTADLGLKVNPLTALSFMSSPDINSLSCSVSGQVKAGWGKKRVELNNVPVSRLLTLIGVSEDDIKKIMKNEK